MDGIDALELKIKSWLWAHQFQYRLEYFSYRERSWSQWSGIRTNFRFDGVPEVFGDGFFLTGKA